MKLSKIFGKRQGQVTNILLILGVVVVFGVLYNYNKSKGLLLDNMTGSNVFSGVTDVEQVQQPVPAGESSEAVESVASGSVKPTSTTDGEQFLAVSGMKSGSGVSNTCNNQQMMDPKDLLPQDSNNEWSNIMPNSDLKNIGMLSAGHHYGINTVGSSLRNPNLQIRSEPVIPQNNVGPWNNTTIEPDNMRRSLELGSTE